MDGETQGICNGERASGRRVRTRHNQLESAKTSLEDARETLQTAQQSDSESTGSDQLDELQETQSQLEDVTYDLETEQESVSSLNDELDDIEAELEELRTRTGRVECEAIEAFNEHMETIVELLGYGNLARIWLEYRYSEGNDNARFELHVTRQADDGTTYEDSVAHLSESEREVTGLVLALAGYLVHDVHEEMPFILLDSLEAIDSERIAQLVEYLEEYGDYVVVALLPEDARALGEAHQRITEI